MIILNEILKKKGNFTYMNIGSGAASTTVGINVVNVHEFRM